MLGKLVNKFQQHSLSDEQSPLENLEPIDPINDFRRNLIPNLLYPNALNDSGTESENEEELEQLETSYLMSIAAAEMQLGPSPPVLTSSPPLISDFDTNSWDSTGCESGIVVRDQSEEPSGGSSNDIAPQQLSVQLNSDASYLENAGNTEAVAAGGYTATSSTQIGFESLSMKHGAFRPFRRRNKEQDAENSLNSATPPPSSQGVIGEKRRYDNITPKPEEERLQSLSGNCPRNNTGGSGIPRETLVACRRTPVKLIIYNPDGLNRNPSKPMVAPARSGPVSGQGESPPFHPVKRGRLINCERPSLDFEKMRERMVNSDWNRSQDSESSEQENKSETELERTTSPDGPRCARHETVGCKEHECTFRSLSVDEPTCSTSKHY